MQLIGRRIGVYDIKSLLGAGGMGEVYLAHDTNLHRDVAIKVLPAEFASDPQRLSRLQREARALASLNHPNIAAIYELEDIAGAPALVLELVAGEMLAARLERAPVPIPEALKIASDIAAALSAAHDRGVIHRDLKPANIKITPDGVVKVLDFGLAKTAPPPDENTTLAATHDGIILGTAPYMSPEQAQGQAVDKRTDIWALGCVLYEMLSGTQAFRGDSFVDTLSRVLTRDPAWDLLPSGCPPAIRTLLRRCLAKDRKQRLADAADVRLELEESMTAPAFDKPDRMTITRGKAWRRVAAYSVASVALAVVVGLGVWLAMQSATSPVTRFTITPPPAAPLTIEGTGRDLAVSPDGRRVVYVAANGTQLVVQSFDQLAPTVLASGGEPSEPFFSPDGQWVAYFDGVTVLKKVPIGGGPVVTVSAVTLHQNGGASWGDDDRIIFSGGSPMGLMWVSAAGGTPETLAMPNRAHGEWRYTQPEVLPGAKTLLLAVKTSRGDHIAAMNLQSGARTVLVPGGNQPQFVPPGYLVYVVGGTLWAAAFDIEGLAVRGSAVPVVERIMTVGGGVGADFAVSADGTLVYVPEAQAATQRALVWVDRRGSEQPTGAPLRAYVYPRLSPDGTRVAVSIADQANDIWIWSLPRKTLERFTFGELFDLHPVWTRDGQRVIWGMVRPNEPPNMYWRAADGTGSPERLIESALVNYPLAITPDGGRLLFRQDGESTGHDLAIVGLEAAKRPAPLIATKFNERNGEISPDGQWIAYESNESGEDEVYVRPFPDVEGGLWLVSHLGGRQPLWARSGRELFFRTADGRVMALAVESGDATAPRRFRAGTPVPVLNTKYYVGSAGLVGRTYDVSPDGKQFLMIKPTAGADSTAPRPSIVVVQNWIEELKQQVRPPEK